MKENKNFKLNGHPELVSGSHEILNRAALVQNDVLFQKGRSMVEMLGVLAVMGVLSVGGVAMYTSAMNKHRANELLNEASKRAAVVAVQAMQGRETLSIAEFPNNSTLKFNTEVTHDTANGQFTLEITGVAEAVCQQMNNAKGPVIRKFEPATCSGDNNTVKLTYNDDMSATAKASDFNTDATGKECTDSGFNWCSGASTPTCQTDCCGALTQCQESCDSETGTITPVTDGTECDYSTEGANDGVCQAGECTEKIEGKRCADNSQCGGVNSGYFCSYNGNVNCQTGPSGQAGRCWVRQFGSLPSRATNDGFFRSKDILDWYSAQNFCASYNNGRLVSLSQIGDVTVPEGEYACSANSSSDYPKCGVTSNTVWENIRAKFGNDWSPWVADLSPSGTTNTNSCYAFYVYLYDDSYAGVYTVDRDRYGYALCK